MTCRVFIEDCLTQNRDLLKRAEAARSKLDEAAWNLAPKNGWSPAQIFEHLSLGNAPYLQKMEEGIRKTQPGDGNEIKTTWFGRMIYKMSGPAGNAPPPKVMTPKTGPFDNTPYEKWHAQQTRLITLLEQAQGQDLNAPKLRNPFMPLFRMTLGDFFAIWTTHTQRHVGQIEERAATKV